MGKTRRKDKTFEDEDRYEELHDYMSKAAKARRGRCKRNKTPWCDEYEFDDTHHESFQKMGKRK
jgi:6-phosphogluconolactonase/glucosamine-6-phosphate isomerase/deaminase